MNGKILEVKNEVDEDEDGLVVKCVRRSWLKIEDDEDEEMMEVL